MRYVPLTEVAEKVLRSIRPTDAGNETFVFLPQSSPLLEKALTRPNLYFRRSFNTVRTKAGLEDVHLHDLTSYSSQSSSYGWSRSQNFSGNIRT